MIKLNSFSPIKSIKSPITNSPPREFATNPFATKPDTFEKMSEVSFTGKSNTQKDYNKTTDTLKTTAENAQTAFNGQLASDGWAGKVADTVSVLWGSKNRATLVQADIDAYKNQVQELENSIKDNKFNEKFEETFGVKYNRENILDYEKKSKRFNEALIMSCTADLMKEKLKTPIETFNKNGGKLQNEHEFRFNPFGANTSSQVYYNEIPKEAVFSSMEASLEDCLGGKEVLDLLVTSSGINPETATKEEKYKTYGVLAEYLVSTAKESSKKALEGTSLKALKVECDNSYKKAYGEKNDIQKRVSDYNRSQDIGAAAVRGVTRSAISSAIFFVNPVSGISKIFMKSAVTMGAKVLVDGSDKMNNELDFTSSDAKKLIKSASISAAEKLASGALGAVIPGIDTGSEILDSVLDCGKNVLMDTGLGLASERLKKGKWATNQIIPRMLISGVFKNLDPDSKLASELLSWTKGGVNQAMKYTTRDYNIVKNVIEGTKIELEKQYSKNKSIYGDLKKLADNKPEEYEKLMAGIIKNEFCRQDE